MTSEFKHEKSRLLFKRFLDSTGDGYIDKKDMDVTVSKICESRGWKPETPEFNSVKKDCYEMLDSLLEELDLNKDGRVSQEEWAIACAKYSKDPSIRPKWLKLQANICFKIASDDQSNIPKENYVKILTTFGYPKEDAIAAFEEISNGKSYLTESEFRQF